MGRAILKLIRYRFLLFAGIFPYLLGSAVAFYSTKVFHLIYFLVGFSGVILVLLGVETFNEYFDAKLGGDRIFMDSKGEIPDYYLTLGLISFGLALVIAVYLTQVRGWPLMLFALFGALAAIFYIAPPFKWSYRGLGELVIFLAYGPGITLGSYYLQTQRIEFTSFLASLVPGLLILALALVNEIPDYFQDKLVGKKNIVVRIGRKRTASLYEIILFSCFVIIAAGLIFRQFPILSSLVFLSLPLACWNILIAKRTYDYPKMFIPAIRGSIFLYLMVITLFIGSCLI